MQEMRLSFTQNKYQSNTLCCCGGREKNRSFFYPCMHTYVSDDELVDSDCRGRERTRCFSVGDDEEEVVVVGEEDTCRAGLQKKGHEEINFTYETNRFTFVLFVPRKFPWQVSKEKQKNK